MTNSSPQEPQNPTPETRKRAAGGVTFDEMIAIVVAFSTIGAILFWSLGGRKGRIASNFGLGRQSSSLTGEDIGFGLGSIGRDSRINIRGSALERDDFRTEERELTDGSSFIDLGDRREVGIRSRVEREPYELDSSRTLAPFGVGTAALPFLADRSDVDRRFGIGNFNRADDGDTPVAVTPKPTERPDRTTPKATTPEKAEPQTTTPKTAVSDDIEMPDDVVPSYWAYPFVKRMSDRALVPDFTEDQDFEPDKLITRAGMATLISQAFDNKPENENIKKFNDVTNQNAIAEDVDEAVRMGFMQGYSDNEFRPLENIPRYQVLVTLATGLGLKPSQDADLILQQFDDGSDIPDWAKQQVAAAAEANLIVNRPNVASNSLSPNESATRAEVAAMIHQALVRTGKLEPIESEYILQPQ